MQSSIQAAIQGAALCLQGASQNPRRDAEILLMHVLGCGQARILAYPEAVLSPAEESAYHRLVERRMRSEPIQYITGTQEFFGLALSVTPDVLIPRPETEHVVEALLHRVDREAALRIADVGAGSGAIAIALAHSLPKSEITAIDLSAAAIEVARRNVQKFALLRRIRLLQADLLAGCEPGSFDAVVSNPPYVADSEVLEVQVANYEPHSALFAGPTGLEVYERLIPQAEAVLRPGGWLVLEIGQGQQPALSRLLESWTETSFIDDLQGIPRVAIARRTPTQDPS